MRGLHEGHVIYRVVFWLIVPVFIITAHPGSIFPKSAPKSLDRSATVTISGKTADSVLVSERHFAVTGSTIIVSERGKRIELGDLAVPCNAQVEYRLRMDEDPLALKITVKKLLRGASKEWPASGSES